jgi:hypothetical protein
MAANGQAKANRTAAKAPSRRANEPRPNRQRANSVIKNNSPDCLRLLMSPYAAAVSIQPKTKSPDLGLLMSAFAKGVFERSGDRFA